MNLSFYHVLSHLIPGTLVYLAVLRFLGLPQNYLDPAMSSFVAYAIGYFVNSASALVEPILFWCWGGKPSSQLLSGKSCGRISFYSHKSLKKLLLARTNTTSPTDDLLFSIAMRVAGNSGKIEEMNGYYAFSRVLFISVLFSGALMTTTPYATHWGFWASLTVLVLISWIRAKERAFYYAKEVLGSALTKLESDNS